MDKMQTFVWPDETIYELMLQILLGNIETELLFFELWTALLNFWIKDKASLSSENHE